MTKEKTMKKTVAVVITALASFLLIVGMLIASIEMFAVNERFFENEYNKLNTAASIGMSDEDLTRVTKNLIAYTTGRRDTLDMQAKINGAEEEVFGQREKDHMVDVRALYLHARMVRTISLVVALALIAAAFAVFGKKALRTLFRSFLVVSGVFALIVLALGVYAAVDFASFWTSFHHLFFTNDLWLLDPRTDVLIMMVPEAFFSSLVTRIIIRFVSIFVTLNIAAAVGAIVMKKRQQGKEAA
jgi:integral membrane protein (TIGR01906 family)